MVKTPLLLLLLLLLSTLTGTVLCQNGDDGSAEETSTQELMTTVGPQDAEDNAEGSDSSLSDAEATSASAVPATEESSSDFAEIGSAEDPSVSTELPGEDGLSPTIILIPVVLVVVIIGMIVCGIFINRRLNKNTRNQELRKEDPYLDGTSTEKVPMPMFEEDVPSVLELEMEELDQWMKEDGKSAEDSAQA